jgi:hypothetical protein
VELGTVKMPARPTLVPALLGLKGQAKQIVEAGARRHAKQTGASANVLAGPDEIFGGSK